MVVLSLRWLGLERGERGRHVGMEGENLLQPHDLEHVFDAGAERGEGELALEALDGLEVFDEGGEAGRAGAAASFSTTWA